MKEINYKSRLLKSTYLTLVTLLLGGGVLLSSTPAGASGASLYLSPASGNKVIGSNFPVTVYVNSGGSATNSYEADLSYPSDKLEISSISTVGTICTLFVSQPSYSAGAASIECGLPSPGYNGASGKLVTVSFRAKSAGSATVSFTGSSKVLANDGSGTNILTSSAGATFILSPAPTPAPSVSSTTHPDQTRWYKASDASLSWSGGYTSYSYQLSQSSGVADQTSEGSARSKDYPGLKDGVWNFSIRGLGSSGWSDASVFKIQIDTVSPLAFSPKSEPSGEIDVRPTLTFKTDDALSEIDHYEVKLDGGNFVKAVSPYKPDRISSGQHTFTVRAFDNAGNFTDGNVGVKVKYVPGPHITKPTGGVLKFQEKLKVVGTGEPNSLVTIFLNDKIIAHDLSADKFGNWNYEDSEVILPGKYKIYAVTSTDGIDSAPSNEVEVSVDAAVVSIGPWNIPLIWLLILLILIILIIIVVAIIVYRRMRRLLGEKQTLDKFRSVKEKITGRLGKLEHQVSRDVETSVSTEELAKIHNKDNYLENKIRQDFEEAKNEIDQDLK